MCIWQDRGASLDCPPDRCLSCVRLIEAPENGVREMTGHIRNVMWALGGLLCLCSGLQGATQDSRRISFRIAASATADEALTQQALKDPGGSVLRENQVVARWLPVAMNARNTLERTGDLVTRETSEAALELLVLVGPNDVNTEHILGVRQGKDREGAPALWVELNEEGFDRSRWFSENQRGRRLAQIIDGHVLRAPRVGPSPSKLFLISGILDPQIKELMNTAQRVPTGKGEPASMLGILGLLAVAVLAVLGLLGTRKEAPHRRAYLWTLPATIAGGAVGAYWLGVRRIHATGELDSATSTIEIVHEIRLLPLVTGALLGAILGFLATRGIRLLVMLAVQWVRRPGGRVPRAGG